MPWSELFKSLFTALDGGFWGLLGALALFGLIGIMLVPKDQRLRAFAIFSALLVVLIFAAVVIAKQVGPGLTRSSPSSSEFGKSIGLSVFRNPPDVFAQGAGVGLKEWRGWLYVGSFDSQTGKLVSSQAYVEVIEPSNVGPVLPKIGYRLKLVRSTDIYDGLPKFSALRLRWELGGKIPLRLCQWALSLKLLENARLC